MLAACNHGSSGPAPLRISSQLPPPNSIVSPDSTVSVAFDRAPDPATLTADAFTVQDAAGSLAGSLAYVATSRTWTWTPDDELPRGVTLTASVAGTVRSSDGAPLPGASTWSFAVSEGVPGALQLVRAGAVVTSIHAARYERDRARIAARNECWELGPSGPGPSEPTPFGNIVQWHVDASGGASALGSLLGPPETTTFAFNRRAASGGWGMPRALSQPFYTITDLRLHGNERGDVLLHVVFGQLPATWREHRVYFASGAVPTQWYESAPQLLAANETMVAAIDSGGRFATLCNDDDYVIVQRHDPALGPVATFTVYEPFARAETLVASADGTLRAVWHVPGRARQAVSLPGQGFAPPTDVPVGILSGCAWRSSPLGDAVGWQGLWMVRFAAGAQQWTQVTLPRDPLAVAMSPRGEVVWLDFQLPNRWLLHRWRAGEAPDEPLLLAEVASAHTASRSGAVSIDGAGRVTVAFVPDVPGDLVAIVVE